MFNNRESEDLAAIDAVAEIAADRARTPGAQSRGNAGGTTGAISNLVVSPPGDTDTTGNEIFIDEDTGQLNAPFVVGVDYVGKPGAYIPAPKRLFDFGI